jgi:phospholipid/cholesterol/gamma-HCH transport system substrate-binding protein
LPKSLELILTYPFPSNAATAARGDFVNLGVTLDVNTQKALQGILGLNLPTAGPTALPTSRQSIPNLPNLPTSGPTTCTTILGVPVCSPKLNRSGFDPELAKVLMPGVAQ